MLLVLASLGMANVKYEDSSLGDEPLEVLESILDLELLLDDKSLDHLWIQDEPIGDVLQCHHDGVCDEEGLGQCEPPVLQRA